MQAEAGESSIKIRSVRTVYLARALAYITENLADNDLSPRKIAAELNVSPRYLRRIFELTDQTASESILEHRLSYCRRALSSTVGPVRSIAEIAHAAGFSDASSLSRAFKRRFGIAPRDYRVSSRPSQHT
jgi:AraC-like DNA-binding protein